MNQVPVTYWEGIASSCWGKYITGVEKEGIMMAHHSAGKPTTALEIGCEGGRWSRLLSELGWVVTCTDIKKEFLDIAQKRIPKAKCILTQPSDKILPLETSSSKLILCIEVFPVIESKWFLSEVNRVLFDGGVLVGIFLNRRSLRGLFVNAKDKRRDKRSFIHYQLSYPRWRNQTSSFGLRVIYERGFCWFPFGRASNSPLIPLFTFMERKLHLYRLVNLSPWVIFIAKKTSKDSI